MSKTITGVRANTIAEVHGFLVPAKARAEKKIAEFVQRLQADPYNTLRFNGFSLEEEAAKVELYSRILRGVGTEGYHTEELLKDLRREVERAVEDVRADVVERSLGKVASELIRDISRGLLR